MVNGAYTGETGTVTHVAQDGERWVALVFLDSGSKEISVFVNDVQLSTEVSTGVQSLAGYELYDLVQVRFMRPLPVLWLLDTTAGAAFCRGRCSPHAMWVDALWRRSVQRTWEWSCTSAARR